MRIWGIPVEKLCKHHLLGEHRELHAIWTIITEQKKGYSRHPETIRWQGKLKALYNRHEQLVKEMAKRGYEHHSDLDKQKARGKQIQDIYVNSISEQIQILQKKRCTCKI